MPADTANPLDGSVTGEAFDGGTREGLDRFDEVLANEGDREGSPGINNHRDAIRRAGIRLEGVATV